VTFEEEWHLSETIKGVDLRKHGTPSMDQIIKREELLVIRCRLQGLLLDSKEHSRLLDIAGTANGPFDVSGKERDQFVTRMGFRILYTGDVNA
jgi:hypothetical protein